MFYSKLNLTFHFEKYKIICESGDYEQCSDDDGDPILQDPKGMSMHEIALLTANTSLQDLSSRPDLAEDVSF